MSESSASEWPEWPVCGLEDMPVTGARGFFLGEGEWPFRGFVVLQGDSVFAYANVCPHARHPLDLQPDEFLVETGDMLRCSSHGALFRPQTGECVFGPCVGQNLLALNVRIDQAGVIHVTAPASMRDARFARWNR